MLKFIFLLFLPIITFSNIEAKTYEVQMLNSKDGKSMVFDPSFLKVEAGDEVVFVPTDKGHDSTALFAPEGAEKWEGKVGEKITVSFKKEGVYIYECTVHAIMGMLGVIQVGKPSNLKEAKEHADGLKSKLVMNKDRLDGILKQIKP